MFKVLFFVTLMITLVINIIFLFATKEKPPDLMTSSFKSRDQELIGTSSSQRRLFLRSNDYYENTPNSFLSNNNNTQFKLHEKDKNRLQYRTVDLPEEEEDDEKRVKSTLSEEIKNKSEYSNLVELAEPSLEAKQSLKKYQTTWKLFKRSKLSYINKQQAKVDRKYDTLQQPKEDEDNSTAQLHDLMKKEANATASSLDDYQIRISTNTSPNSNDSEVKTLPSVIISIPHDSSKTATSSESSINVKTIISSHDIDEAKHKEKQRDQAIQSQSRGRFFLPNSRSLNIRVKSSRNHVFVSVDNIVIYESKSSSFRNFVQDSLQSSSAAAEFTSTAAGLGSNIYDETSSTNGRGIHVIVLSQYDGRVMAKRTFDTYSPNQDEELCFFINMILDGRILIFAIKDEGSFKMPPNSLARELLQKLGSRHIMKLRWRDMWAFVTRKVTLMETNSRIVELAPQPAAKVEVDSTLAAHLHSPPLAANSNQLLGLDSVDSADETTGNTHNLAEGLSKSARFSDWAPPVILQVRVHLQTRPNSTLGSTSHSDYDNVNDAHHNNHHHQAEQQQQQQQQQLQLQLRPSQRADYLNSVECNWNSGNEDEDLRRAEFCSNVEGYGQVCDCNYPAPISFKPRKMANSQLDQVPIVVMASNRPYYLYRMLRSLLNVDGINSSMVSVFIDGFYDEPLMVSRLFKLRAIQQRPLGQRSARISHHYKSSLTATFELFPRAEFAIIFEEDLDVARDTLIYFNQTIELLRSDPSLYCVSAWNDQGYEHSVANNCLLYRIETLPGLGWLLSRRLYKEELEPNWPSADQAHDWDMWIRTEPIRKGRECIIPDISRTFHFGSTGTNINSYFQRQYFSKHAFNVIPCDSFLNTSLLSQEPYEQLLESLVREAQVVEPSPDQAAQNSTTFLCSLATDNLLANNHHQFANTPEENKGSLTADHVKKIAATNNVIYIEMIDKHDFRNWLKLAKCWRIWDLDARGQHKSMWRLHLNGIHTFVIGVPASPYSRFKPSNLVPFKLT